MSILFGKVASYFIWIVIVLVVWEVISRYLLNAPTVWTQGYVQRFFAAYFILIGAYTLVRNSHVRVDLVLGTSSPRWNAFTDLLNYSLLFIWAAALCWEGWEYFFDAWRFNELDSGALRHPMWPVKLSLVIGMGLMALQAAAEIIRAIVLIINPKKEVPRVVST
ncbi:TRAP-type mannitol/chloroaromatic compound transport system permease small subunit [Natronocella acetinitrilica]|uniref:TRAP transporter small permease protein n=1 Tax=Natronocella acetinitrilica TaxID=414046 RepID=A0AAE3G7C7_9GAMM|nr:TRAP transporter small permease subunit [Natronocella acetinitrilica]MCP1677175.1 TRAP-type mannitol/chloroaromatic compound transport system permease small subunit [Natronocella acetinitrilica]